MKTSGVKRATLKEGQQAVRNSGYDVRGKDNFRVELLTYHQKYQFGEKKKKPIMLCSPDQGKTGEAGGWEVEEWGVGRKEFIEKKILVGGESVPWKIRTTGTNPEGKKKEG